MVIPCLKAIEAKPAFIWNHIKRLLSHAAACKDNASLSELYLYGELGEYHLN